MGREKIVPNGRSVRYIVFRHHGLDEQVDANNKNRIKTQKK